MLTGEEQQVFILSFSEQNQSLHRLKKKNLQDLQLPYVGATVA